MEFNGDYKAKDVLNFEGYKDKIKSDRNKTGLNEAIVTGIGRIRGMRCVLAVMDSGFRMGSMGTVVGQKIYEAAKKACLEKIPFIIFSASGGARMQEGMLSLMQMSKTSFAIDMLREAGILSVVVMTNPTTGGVSASFATLGDILIAEPGAIIGFAGKKVIAQTLKSDLPEGFQTAEFLLQHGHIDDIVSRSDQQKYLGNLIMICVNTRHSYFTKEKNKEIQEKYEHYKNQKSKAPVKHPLDKLQIIRSESRPRSKDYINLIFKDFVELHGDRLIEDDKAIVAGIGTLHGMPVTVIGHQRGENLDENIKCNFGMARPTGYRKVVRLINQSNRLHRPIITFIDTKGADPTASSEILNQSYAISKSILAMAESTVPIISVVIGEGGSGGALALGNGNKVLMLENSLYSVISPEGAASILWKDSSKIKEAIENLKITAQDLMRFSIIDDIIPEPEANASSNVSEQAKIIKGYLMKYLADMSSLTGQEIKRQRVEKYEAIGKII